MSAILASATYAPRRGMRAVGGTTKTGTGAIAARAPDTDPSAAARHLP
jgi:hypothetical protein